MNFAAYDAVRQIRDRTQVVAALNECNSLHDAVPRANDLVKRAEALAGQLGITELPAPPTRRPDPPAKMCRIVERRAELLMALIRSSHHPAARKSYPAFLTAVRGLAAAVQ